MKFGLSSMLLRNPRQQTAPIGPAARRARHGSSRALSMVDGSIGPRSPPILGRNGAAAAGRGAVQVCCVCDAAARGGYRSRHRTGCSTRPYALLTGRVCGGGGGAARIARGRRRTSCRPRGECASPRQLRAADKACAVAGDD